MNRLKTKALVVFTLIAGFYVGCRQQPPANVGGPSQVYAEGLGQGFRAPVKLGEVEALADSFTVEHLYQSSGGKISAGVYMKMAAEGSLWELVRKERQKRLEMYLKENSQGYEAFVRGPVAFNGTPAIIFVLLQKVLPELFGQKAFEDNVGLKFTNSQHSLPLGMAFTQPPLVPPSDKSPWAVTFTCAACHLQEGRSQDGQVTELVGAPNRRFDINRYRQILSQAVQAPSYNLKSFREALEKIHPQDLFGAEFALQAQWEKSTFLAQGGDTGLAIMEAFKKGVLARGQITNQTLGQYSYHGDLSLLESSPGKVEAFGFATLALLPTGSLEKNPQQTLERYLPKNPSVTDMMAVWQQNKRKLSQWDGSLKLKLLRNLGAELGVAGDPMAVNLVNGQTTTGFLGDLPAPAYPYKIDLIRAARGQRVYQATCGGCHDYERFLEVETIGTDPGRARGLTPGARDLLIGGLRDACQGADSAICQAPDDDVLLPRQSRPGYQALPLSGIWSRGPYLHNGSIPTVKQLLVPVSRAPIFRVGSLDFDQTQLGFKWDAELKSAGIRSGPRLQVDASMLGLSNQGHSDPEVFFGGMDFGQEPEVLADLLEYLKSL